MKKILFFLLFTASLMSAFGQYEASNWFFGDHAGLSFNTGSPVSLSGGQIMTEEGCSSISDACGHLLLYTDGTTVWNANHAVMTNGTVLYGNSSSTQSGIVVPMPDNDNIYYIFTVDHGFNSPSVRGMCYTKVDMSLSGGLGEVVLSEKNVSLVDSASEKVTAVISSDESSIWVITFAPGTSSVSAPYHVQGSNFNTFYAFRITDTGVQSTAVVSQVSMHVMGGVGYMKVSPDGTKLAIANMYDSSAYLLDFDDVTGIISNPTNLTMPASSNEPYGVEFSMDSSKLYLSDKGSYSSGALLQYDLSNSNAMTVISTRQNYRSALQLSLDGKIYQTHTTDYAVGSSRMSVIEDPNEAGTACHYRYSYINLRSGMTCHQGLPPFIQSYFLQVSVPETTAEFNDLLEVTTNQPFSSADWDFGDGTTATTLPDNPPDDTHTQSTHLFNTPGTYTISVVLHLLLGCDISVSKTVQVLPILSSDLTGFCTSVASGHEAIDLHRFDAVIIALQPVGSYDIHYYISDSDVLSNTDEILGLYTNVTSNDPIYYSVVNTSTSTKSYGVFHLRISPKPVITAVTAYEICDNDTDGFSSFDLTTKVSEILDTQTNPPFSVNFYPTQADAEALTNEITAPYTNTTAYNETIWYSITNADTGCVSYGSFDLIVHPLIDLPMTDTFHICTGSTAQVDAPAGFVSYSWSSGESTQEITVASGGSYTVTVTNSDGCSNSKTVTVYESAPAIIENVDIVDFTANNTITVIVSGIGNYEYSLDGTNFQESNVFTGLLAGTYMVYVNDINGCGMVSENIELLGASPFFTPNGDGFNDYWKIINVEKRPGTYVNIYDRYGKLLKVLLSTEEGWDGTFNGAPLPSTDYWFTAFVKEGDKVRQVKGHFTLKR